MFVLEVFQVLLAVGGVYDDQEVILATVDDHVVHRPPILVADRAVAGLADVQPSHVAGDEALDGGLGVGAAEDGLAHVRDVEEAGVVAHGVVLGLYALVLHGHLVAGEVHEPGAPSLVLVVERGVFEVSRHPYHLALSWRAARVSSRRRVGACVGASSRSSGLVSASSSIVPTKSSRVSLDSVSVGSISMASLTTRGK